LTVVSRRLIDFSDGAAIFINVASLWRCAMLGLRILSPMKLHLRKNWVWLLLLPAALSWLLAVLAKPSGGTAFRVELAIIGSCSCFFGFALDFKSFSTFKERFWGGLFFSGGSLGLISNVVFIGCICGEPSAPTPTPQQKLQWEIESKAEVAKQIVPRETQADATMLDLTTLYDATLPGLSVWHPPSLRALEPGTHTWEGIKFDVRGIVMSQNQPGGKITDIPVGQKCSEIAFLNGANQNVGHYKDSLFNRLVVHFANGHAETFPLVFDQDFVFSRGVNSRDLNYAVTNSVVWEERISTDGTSRPNIVFHLTKWKNPFPTETVATIDFVPPAAYAYANAFLVAVTVRPVEP
jgi:hypothetical protein